ncbi:MAG: DUF2007 domain-containing protein [Acidobacteria bacterium]|nr:DUF2007 domain-containing protein [Acidobacteriota bacterium]
MNKKINNDEIVTIASYSDPAAAHLALSVLNDAGIDAFLSGEEANSLIPPALGARLQVRAADQASATALLNDVPGQAALTGDGNDL